MPYALQELIDHLPFAVYVCEGPGGTILFYNERAAELWGRRPLIGDPDQRFCGSHRLFRTDGTPLPHASTPMAEVLRSGAQRDEEIVIERPDGSRVTVAVHATPLRDLNGRVVGAVNSFHDVSPRRATEDALRLSEARYRAIVENQPEMICRFLADGTFTFVNEAYCRYFGRTRDELIGRTYAPNVHPEDVPQIQARVAALSPGQPVVVIENRVFRADGEVRWTQWTNSALYDAQGRLVELQATGRDITEQRQAEESLRSTVQTLEGLYRLTDLVGRARDRLAVCRAGVDAILDIAGASRASVLLFDDARVMRFVAWRGLSERYRAAVEGHSPWTPDAEDPTPILIEDVREAPSLGPLREVVLSEGIRALAFIPLLDPGRRLLGKFMLYHDAPHAFRPEELRLAGTIAQHVGSGLARIQAQEAIAALLARERAARQEADAARAEAERSNRAKDEFLAMLSHELRNPLGVIATAAGLLERFELGPETRRPREMIRKQTDHLARLLDDLLDVARITSGRIELRRETLDLRDAVRQAAEAQRARLEAKGQALTLSPGDDDAAVSVDPVRLQQVLGNLLSNAWKYTPAGGSVRIAVETDGGTAVLRVRDDGAGIPPEKLDTIFELFAQANPTLSRTEGGLGIGLTLVKRVVELHGGTVSARSEGPGRGAEFEVRLPLVAAVPATGTAARAPRASAARRVLVVEDHDDGREALAAILRSYGHEVFEAGTGAEALAKAERHRPDVVLLDIGLPDRDGYEIAAELRRRSGSRACLVALTGYGQPADRARTRAAGFDAHLVKPVAPDTLADVLAGALGRVSEPRPRTPARSDAT